MYYCYGQLRTSKGGIPVGGSDAAYAWGVFTAGEHPCEIIAGTFRSGDSSETYTVAIVPPDFPSLDGTTLISGSNQGVMALFHARGGVFTSENPGDIYSANGATVNTPIIVPPFHNVVVFCLTPSAVDFKVYFMGLDLVKP
jgi:hypothetical protein